MEVVETKFEAVDKTSPVMQKMGEQADKLAQRSEKAQHAVEKVGKHEAAGVPKWQEGLSSVEREKIAEDRKELLVRRARVRSIQLEQSRETQRNRLMETSVGLVIGAESQVAKHFGKVAMTMDTMGPQLEAMGGKAGQIGQAFNKFGGYIAAAGVGIEVLSKIDEVTGHNLEKGFESIFASMAGVSETEEEREKALEQNAKLMGFRNEEDRKAFSRMQLRAGAEMKLERSAEKQAEKLGAMPTDKTSEAMDQFRWRALDAAKQLAMQNNVELKEAYKVLTDATEHSAASTVARMAHQEQLSDIEKNMARSIGAMPMDEYREVLVAQVEQLVRSNKIAATDAEAVVEHAAELYRARDLLAASNQQRSEEVEAFAEKSKAEDEMRAAVYEYSKLLDKVPLRATAEQLEHANQQIEQFALLATEQFGFSPERMKQFMGELKSKQVKMQYHVSYPNARFDIRQNFAEGFDPDRIALAFSQDLGRLGERKMQSNQVLNPYGSL